MSKRNHDVPDELLSSLLANYKKPEDLIGENGLLKQLTKLLVEKALDAEMTEHLGHDRHAPVANPAGNARNGRSRKTLKGEFGALPIEVPRDRQGSFEPQLIPKHQTRWAGFDDKILSLYARGMTVREIQAHLEEMYGAEVSPSLISTVTDAVVDEVKAWQARPLDPVYPIVYLDCIHVKVREGAVRVKAVYLAIGVTMAGEKEMLGLWLAQTEGAKFWAGVCAELANRGVRDVLIVCCDGLTGLPEAIEATWQNATVQTCVVHLIRASMRFVSYKDRKAVAAALKPIYTASNDKSATDAFAAFQNSDWGKKYPAAVATWENAWERFIPFLAFPPELRKVIYTTNSIESLNYQLRKVTKNRGHFPNDAAVVKLLWLAICNIEDKRARERAKDRGKPAGQRKSQPRLVEGQTVTNWKQALGQLALAYPERINPYL